MNAQTFTPSPVEVIAGALRDAATCYRDGAQEAAAEHISRAQRAMHRHGITAELIGQAQVVGSFAFLGLMDRAAEVSEDIAGAVEVLYS